MIKLINYLKLIRLHKPVGALLLWFPTAWALWLANQGAPSPNLVFYFFIGTFLMRSAGCVVNDIVDRNIDQHVIRTRLRPLTSGKVSLLGAFIILLVLLLGALLILIQLPKICFYYALFSLCITFLYPFCKRFIQAPQLVLGIAFSMGIPMAFVASGQTFSLIELTIFILNFFWIVAYDTVYAMTDRSDDIVLGVNSTAILFGKYDYLIVSCLLVLINVMWLLLGFYLNFTLVFYVIWVLASLTLIYQCYLLKDTKNSQRAFSINVYYGLLMWLAVYTTRL